ncbi:HAD family hydrolase [Candidatus Woesearchaeota archaeon]|nr:MAG: HAD family hydrolase [Candidatus Woesearchaeota archaeon]
MKAVIFDWDGVIVDSPRFFHEMYQFISKNNGKHYPYKTAEELKKNFREPFYQIYELSGFTWPEDRPKISKYYHEFMNSGKIDFFPDVVSVIKQLHNSGFKLAIASSGSHPFILKKLAEEGLQDCFEIVVAHDDVKNLKPNPECLFKCMSVLQTKPSETCYIGDFYTDIIAGKAAGVKTIAVTWGFLTKKELRTEKPDFIVDKPEELLNVLKK